MRARVDRRREDGQLAAQRSVKHRVAKRLIDDAEWAEEAFAVEDLNLPPADLLLHAEAVDGTNRELMHTVLDARRVDVRDPAGKQRTRKVWECVADVRPRITEHRGLHHQV